MVDLLQRAARRPEGDRTEDLPPRPVIVSACAVSAAVAVAGLIVAFGLSFIAWLSGSQGSTADAFRAGALGWLAGHGSGLTVSGAPVTAIPIGLLAVIGAAFVTLAQRLATGSSILGPREVVLFAGTAGATYGVVLALTAALSAGDQVTAGAWRSALAGFVLAGVFAGLGASRQAGLLEQWWDALPWQVRAGARGTVYATSALLTAGLAMTVVLLLADTETFGRSWSTLDPGVVGGIGLGLLCLALAPNAVLWTVAVLLGPGVEVGTATSVTLTHVSLGPVPAFPLLAALPDPGDQPAGMIALAAVPVLAGLLGGYVACRQPTGGWQDAATRGGVSGAAAALVCGLLMVLASGAVGPGRMADVGPGVWSCTLAALVALSVGGALGGVLGHYRGHRGDDRAE